MPSSVGDPTPHPSPFLQGPFAPVENEVDAEDLEIAFGAIPADLVGAYVRNGPNPAFPSRGGHHWFEGDGMLHRVHFKEEGKGAGFRNRFVRTASYLYQLSYGKKHNKRYFHSAFMDLRGFRSLVSLLLWRVADLLRQKLRLMWLIPMNPWGQRDLANMNIVPHGNNVYALVESGLPTKVKMPSLETVGVENFGGKLQHPFTAHPKICPITGEMIFFCYQADMPHCVLSSLSPDGVKGPSVDVGLDQGVMMHDFAITKNFAVIIDLPAVFDKKNVFKNNTIYQYDPERPGRIGLVRRSAISDRSVQLGTSSFDDHNPSRLRKVPVEWFLVGKSCYSFHVLNAFEEEDGSGVVLDLIIYSGQIDLDLARFLANVHQHNTPGGRLTRWTMRYGAVRVEESIFLPSHDFEFPVINNKFCGLKHRFGYFATGSFPTKKHELDLQFRGVTKYDFSTNITLEWHTEDGETNDEFVFVAKKQQQQQTSPIDEDDGYLVGYTVRPDFASSHLVILDAKSMKLLCRLKLPQRVPHGFHGNWCPPSSFATN